MTASSPDDRIARARAVRIEDEIRRRGITLKGNSAEREGPCPKCGGVDRFSINVKEQVWNCRGCKTKKIKGDVIGLVQWLDGCNFVHACKTLNGEPPPKPNGKDRIAAEPTKVVAERRGRGDDQLWHRIWKDTRHPLGTPVDAYLARRHLILPLDADDCLRFHPRCPFGKNDDGRTIYTPCMVALVRNAVTNEPQAIHRTALDLSGRKVSIGGGRMAFGPIAGGAIKLTADENVTIAIGIGEGIETALSLQWIPEWAGSPVWSVLNDSGVANFPVLAGIETLVVAVDHDDAGEKAALAVADRWRAASREVLLFEAVNPDDDLNDVIGDE